MKKIILRLFNYFLKKNVKDDDIIDGKHKHYSISADHKWQDIPTDILHSIIQRLSLADSVRISAVSRSWRFISKHNIIARSPLVPWLMLPHDKHSQVLRFFDLCEDRFYNFNLPNNLQGGWCCGSSKGWLVMLKCPPLISDPHILMLIHMCSPDLISNILQILIMFLYNPLSGIQVKLPSVNTIPCFPTFLDLLRDAHNLSEFITKVELSTRDADDPNCIIAATFFGTVLALCRPGDKSWTIFKYEKDFFVRDILFSNGILHALISYCENEEDQEEQVECQTCTIKVGDGGPGITVNLIPKGNFEIDVIYPEGVGVDWVALKVKFSSYLVESGGELLIVRKIENVLDTELIDHARGVLDAHAEVHEDDIVQFKYNKTSGFEVYKIIGDSISSNVRLTRMNRLNDQILFVAAASTSLSIPASHPNGLKENCIYFLHDFNYVLRDIDPILSRESGVFYLENERIVRCFPSTQNSTYCKTCWFSPNI